MTAHAPAPSSIGTMLESGVELLMCNRCDHLCRPQDRDLSMPPSDCPNCYGGRLRRPRGRLMSCSLTTDAVRERRKTVTRRLGWKLLGAGDRLWLCEKVMGRKGAPLVRLAYVEVVSARRERLWSIDEADVVREGLRHDDSDFAEWDAETGYPTPLSWTQWFCDHMDVMPDDLVTRIEWRYLDV